MALRSHEAAFQPREEQPPSVARESLGVPFEGIADEQERNPFGCWMAGPKSFEKGNASDNCFFLKGERGRNATGCQLAVIGQTAAFTCKMVVPIGTDFATHSINLQAPTPNPPFFRLSANCLMLHRKWMTT